MQFVLPSYNKVRSTPIVATSTVTIFADPTLDTSTSQANMHASLTRMRKGYPRIYPKTGPEQGSVLIEVTTRLFKGNALASAVEKIEVSSSNLAS